ncbi:MAG TPA: hypothetical protein VGZ29_11880 [Terriglobia bacterium]|nr:hypothetical protein [Terriglobia bacterium]
MNQYSASPPRAQIEMLESRQLLSAAHVLTAAAVHTRPTPPNVVGFYAGHFSGTIGSSPTSGVLEFVFSSESKTGKLSGDFLSTNVLFALSGSISVKGKYSFHSTVFVVRQTETLTGTVTANADGTTLAGNFIIKNKTRPTIHATFSAPLVTRNVPSSL